MYVNFGFVCLLLQYINGVGYFDSLNIYLPLWSLGKIFTTVGGDFVVTPVADSSDARIKMATGVTDLHYFVFTQCSHFVHY